MTPIEWLAAQCKSVGDGLFALVDTMVPPVPAEVSQACLQISGALDQAAPALGLVPWSSFAVGFTIYLGCLTAALVIKFSRVLASFATLGGGSAA